MLGMRLWPASAPGRLLWPTVGVLLALMSLLEWSIEGTARYGPWIVVPGLVVGLALAVCPREPEAAALAGAVSVLGNLLAGAPGPGGAQLIGMGLLVGHAVAVLPPRRGAGTTAAAAVLVTALGAVLTPNPWESVFYLLVLGAASGVGALVAQSRRRARELEVLAARLAEQQETAAAAAAVAERARIAREVHDSVAHSVSVMVLQMGGLRRLLPGHPQAQQVLLDLERLGRESVDEMRRVVGILREEADGAPAPQPSLQRLDAVLGELRAGDDRRPGADRHAGPAAAAGRRLRRPGRAGGAVQRRPARRCRRHPGGAGLARRPGHRHGHRRRPAADDPARRPGCR